MKKEVFLIFFLLLGLVFGFFYFSKFSKPKISSLNSKNLVSSPSELNPPVSQNLILFYGIGCPHCAKVDSFIEKNNIQEKISFEKREVYFNQENRRILGEAAKDCKLGERSVGVPFLWDRENHECIIGDQPVIDFFQKKIGL
ncbi:MAG: hypothetical protein ACPLZH_00510 [Minisyncoccales bacterium]